MMANKVNLKKYLICTFIISISLLIIFLVINIYEYATYTKNFNNKLSAIILKLKEYYPNISEGEIIEILNSKNTDKSILKKYSIDINKDSIVLENSESYYKFLGLNIVFLILSFSILICIFIKYNKQKDKDISEITKYIEEINKKNYTLHIDEISEDELSILKNEIYKTTIMLKESADNSMKDKIELKNSLEDISHQLKTPLTSILIMLDNLIDEPDMDSNVRDEFIRDIKREVMNINFLVQAILKLSKFDSNTVDFMREKNCMKSIIDKSMQNVSTLCDLKNIKIEINGNEKDILYCDFRWQVEAITNIIKNCIDHSKEGSKVVINYGQNNVYSYINIQDFGDGILKKDLPHIFERFYKGENASEDSIGIGLALSKTIIEKDNGNISVESNNNGTKFEIKYFIDIIPL